MEIPGGSWWPMTTTACQWFRTELIEPAVYEPIKWWHPDRWWRNAYTGDVAWPWNAWRDNPRERCVKDAVYKYLPIEGATGDTYTPCIEDLGSTISLGVGMVKTP